MGPKRRDSKQSLSHTLIKMPAMSPCFQSSRAYQGRIAMNENENEVWENEEEEEEVEVWESVLRRIQDIEKRITTLEEIVKTPK